MSCAKLTQQQVEDPEFLWRCDKGLCKRSRKRKNEGKNGLVIGGKTPKAPTTWIKKIRPCPPPEHAELSAQPPSPQVVEPIVAVAAAVATDTGDGHTVGAAVDYNLMAEAAIDAAEIWFENDKRTPQEQFLQLGELYKMVKARCQAVCPGYENFI